MTDDLSPTFPDPLDYDLERQKLARRRKIAEDLIATEADSPRMLGNWVLNTGPAGGVAAAIGRGIGTYDMTKIDAQDKLLSANEARDRNRIAAELGKTGTKQQTYDPVANPGTGPLVNGEVPMTPEEEKARRFGLYGQGMGVPSLRKTLEAQLGAELKAPLQEELLDSKLAGAAAVQDARNKAMLEGINARVEGAIRAKQTPSIHITNSGASGFKVPAGYMLNATGDGVVPIPGSDKDPSTAKPTKLNPKQLETQRAYVDLEKSLNEYDKLLDAYDPRSGNALDMTTRAAIESAHTDVMMKLKDLYQMGAPQQGDLMMLERGLDSPVTLNGTVKSATFGTEPFKAKSKQLRTLLNNSRDSFDVQFNTTSPRHQPASPTAPAGAPRSVSEAEYNNLPVGATYIGPDGNARRKQ